MRERRYTQSLYATTVYAFKCCIQVYMYLSIVVIKIEQKENTIELRAFERIYSEKLSPLMIGDSKNVKETKDEIFDASFLDRL